MKRFFFTTIALAAVAVGCTKSGLIESPQTYEDPITFETYTGKAPVTKATEAKNETLQGSGFQVVGYLEQPNGTTIDVSKKPYLYRTVNYSSGKWGYDNAAYWPQGEELTFVAYGLNGAAAFDENTADYSKLPYTVPDAIGDQKDLVIGKVIQNHDKSKGIVAVDFHHVLSRVGFKVITSGDSKVNATIKNITISGDFVTGGTFDLTKAVYDNSGATAYTAPSNLTYGDNSQTVTATEYSLFNSDYASDTTTDKDYPCFVATGNSTQEIYANNTFNPHSNPRTDFTDPTNSSQTNKDNRFLMIMPQYTVTPASTEGGDPTISGIDVDIRVIYQLTDAEEQVADFKLTDFTFMPGKAYEIVFTISTVSVGFNVDVQGWNTTHDKANTTITPAA